MRATGRDDRPRRGLPDGLLVAGIAVFLLGGTLLWVFSAGGGAAVLGASRAWLTGLLGSRLFLVCLGVAGACSALLAVLGLLLWRVGRPGRATRRARVEAGEVMVEFALVFPVMLMLVLIMIQVQQLMAGHICVNYAAYCGARSAIVTIPRSFGGTEPWNILGDETSSLKRRRIKLAAIWALLPLSCGRLEIGSGDPGELSQGLQRFFSLADREPPGWVGPVLGRRFKYADDYTNVRIEPPADGLKYKSDEDITVRVRHVFYLSVPYAASLFRKLTGDDGVTLPFGAGEYGTVMRSSCTLTNEGVRDYVDVEEYEEKTGWEPPE